MAAFSLCLQGQGEWLCPDPDMSDTGTIRLPWLYDMRNGGCLTPVRVHSPSTCWASAAMTVLESSLCKALGEAGTFSEYHLIDHHGFDPGRTSSGNHYMVTAYLARHSGPLICQPEDGTPEIPNSCLPVTYTQARYLPGERSLIKRMLMTCGPVFSMMYFKDAYFDTTTHVYCYSGLSRINHAVAIAGWNDTLVTRCGQGAWIVQNSKGVLFGEEGFFYVAYQDSSFLRYNAIWPGWIRSGDDLRVLYYDTLGAYRGLGFDGPDGTGLVRFTAENDLRLVRVGTFVNHPDTRLEIQVLAAFPDSLEPYSRLTGIPDTICSFAGYYSFPLPDHVKLKTGEDFYILIRYSCEGQTLPIPVETHVSGYSDPLMAEDRCWVGPDHRKWPGIWHPCGKNSLMQSLEVNLCIKAYVKPDD
ncbi:MAG: hypothetical protein JW861_00440 [Bacteroidales bacterium]|nr:hypothetical protein [Bacteroidales bacterium]